MSYEIRECSLEDLPDWWTLRLMALQDSPDGFGSDYESMKSLDPVAHHGDRGYFTGSVNRLFAAFSSANEIAGQAAVYADSGKRSHIAYVVSVFTHPDHRKHGLGTALVQACVEHLATFPEITSVRISVNSKNLSARRIYESLGFETWGEEPDAIRNASGSWDNECHMVLRRGSA